MKKKKSVGCNYCYVWRTNAVDLQIHNPYLNSDLHVLNVAVQREATLVTHNMLWIEWGTKSVVYHMVYLSLLGFVCMDSTHREHVTRIASLFWKNWLHLHGMAKFHLPRPRILGAKRLEPRTFLEQQHICIHVYVMLTPLLAWAHISISSPVSVYM